MLLRILKLLISTLLWIVDSIRVYIAESLGKKVLGECVILYFHNITSGQRRLFAKQMDTLQRLTCTISIENRIKLDRRFRYSAVTFDDGFASAFENAVPELQKRGIPLTFFVPSDFLGRMATWGRYTENYLSEINGDHRIISAEQLRILAGLKLVTIGSHSLSHVNLTKIGKEAAIREMQHSKLTLCSLTERNIDTLSFPYGGFGERELIFAKQLEYKRVFNTLPVATRFLKNDFVFGRVEADATDWLWEFKLKILGCYRWMPLAYSKKKSLKALVRMEFLNKSKKSLLGNTTVSKLPVESGDDK